MTDPHYNFEGGIPKYIHMILQEAETDMVSTSRAEMRNELQKLAPKNEDCGSPLPHFYWFCHTIHVNATVVDSFHSIFFTITFKLV